MGCVIFWLIALAVGLGAGLGIGLSKKNKYVMLHPTQNRVSWLTTEQE